MNDEQTYLILFFLVALVACFLLMGCVSKTVYDHGTSDAYLRGLQNARDIAHQQQCKDAVEIISGRIELEKMKQKSK